MYRDWMARGHKQSCTRNQVLTSSNTNTHATLSTCLLTVGVELLRKHLGYVTWGLRNENLQGSINRLFNSYTFELYFFSERSLGTQPEKLHPRLSDSREEMVIHANYERLFFFVRGRTHAQATVIDDRVNCRRAIAGVSAVARLSLYVTCFDECLLHWGPRADVCTTCLSNVCSLCKTLVGVSRQQSRAAPFFRSVHVPLHSVRA